MWSARWKLVSLWLSQTARVTADNALRFFVCIAYANQSDDHRNSAWYLVTGLFALPAVVLAPFNGAICNTLPKSRVLISTALIGFLIMGVFAFLQGHWLVCWVLISISSAVYGPTRYAMLPAAAEDTKWALPRINGFIEMGTFTAILAGLLLMVGPYFREMVVFDTWNAAIVLILVLNGVALMTALPVWFPSDVRRDESPWIAVRGFFSDCAAIWREPEARICLIGLSGKRGLIIGMSNAMLALLFSGRLELEDIAIIVSWVAGGVAVGSLLAGLQKHPRRVLGFVPWGGLGLTIGLMYAASVDKPNVWFCAVIGMMAGLINVPLASTYQAALPADARGNGMAVRNMTDYLCAAVVGIGMTVLTHTISLSPAMQLWIIAAIALLATAASWWIFRRELVENLLEIPFFFMYRVRSAGPGAESFPLKGPVVVVCNHSAYMDPLWLGKVLPRALKVMMTSLFFDHWFLRLNMVYIADAIRVQHSEFRRNVPELKVAIAALDAGKVLVIFPEGRLRRSEEQPIKLFGQGVWHILSERPNTPVVICWIEGGWGSFFSYFKGKPTKNKPIDFQHAISVAIGPPHVIDPEVLADVRKTRVYLMEQCGDTRKYLGLDPIKPQRADIEAAEAAGEGEPAEDTVG